MTRNLYFDRNVFHHIRDKKDVTDGDIQVLKEAIACGRITIFRSLTLIEETLPVLKSSVGIAKVEKQLLVDLTESKKVIKPPEELLRDDVLAYAKGQEMPSPFTLEFPDLEELLTPAMADLTDLLNVVNDTQAQKLYMQAEFKVAKNHDGEYFKTQQKGSKPSFKKYFDSHASEMVRDLADQLGILDACKNRGLGGMLEIKSVSLYVGVGLSYSYAQIFEGRAPHAGDSRDLHHSVIASAVDTFVTHDPKLRALLSRVQVKNFEAVDLQTLLQELRKTSDAVLPVGSS